MVYKLHCCFVVETREYREFFYQHDADKFADAQTRSGNQVLRATNRVDLK